jgi:hypothetical protein
MPDVLEKALRVAQGLPAAALVLAFALVACGGSAGTGGAADPVPPDDYVRSVCRAVSDWNDDVAAAFRATDELPDSDRPATIRRDFVGFFDQLQEVTDDLVARVEDASRPDLPEGEAAAAALQSGVRAAANELEANRDAFAAIPLSDVEPAASLEGALTVMAEQFDAVYRSVEGLDDAAPALGRAREHEPACHELRQLD